MSEMNYVNHGKGLRASAAVKAIALILAVICGAGAAFGWIYCYFHWNTIFHIGDYTGSVAWDLAMEQSRYFLFDYLSIQWKQKNGQSLTYLEDQDLAARAASLDPEGTNFRYTVRDNNTGRLLYSSCGADSLEGVSQVGGSLRTYTYPDLDQWYISYSEPVRMYILLDEYGRQVGSADTYGRLEVQLKNIHKDREQVIEQWAIEYGVLDDLPVPDAFQAARNDYRQTDPIWLIATLGATAAFLVLAVFLMSCAGRRRGREEFTLNWSDRIPYDLALGVGGFLGCAAVGGVTELLRQAVYCWRYNSEPEQIPVLAGLAGALLVGIFALSLWGLMTTATRVKTHTLLRNTVIWRLGRWLWRGAKKVWAALGRAMGALPLMARVIAGAVGYCLLTLFLTAGLFRTHNAIFFLLFFLVNAALLVLVCRWALAWADLRKATQAIVSGHPDTPVDTSHMKYLPSLREHAGQLGDLGGAIDLAVREQLKSERMKTQLITNVSHDLKTPLTSIINYVDLLKKEDIENETAREYIEVLDRKSSQLKKLTEDLVEASKASTGAIAIDRERLGMVQLVTQALGEYSEKFSAAGLTLVSTLPEEVYVSADGRHMWRVLDNLLGNCRKYAMTGTRVYLDLTADGRAVTLSLKNISAQQLNVPPEQLMERFVRGDESRTTEGSGLGLSIAQDLTQLQDGAFRVEVDGDLFKAVLSLPQVP